MYSVGFGYWIARGVDVYGRIIYGEMCLGGRFCLGMCYGIVYRDVGLQCVFPVGSAILSFFLVFVMSNWGLADVVGICHNL